jgi:hypothetical protein
MLAIFRTLLAVSAILSTEIGLAGVSVLGPAPNSGSAYATHVHQCLDGDKLVACPDSVEMDSDVQNKMYLHFVNGAYAEIDKAYNTFRTGKERFKDGRWKLVKLEQAIEKGFENRDSWKKDLDRLKAWQTQNPKSFIAKFAEASYWRAYAWHARGNGYSKETPKEAWELYRLRLNQSLRILTDLYPEASTNPSWYPMMIRVALSMGAEPAQIRAIFDEGQKLFPQYHSIYFAMATVYEPRWGGSASLFDNFAKEAVKMTNAFEGDGMYARIYWTVDFRGLIPFENRKTSPTWQSLKIGFDSLQARYTKSEHNKSQFAHVVCRTTESALYRQVRNDLGIYVDEALFTVAPLDACDAKHGWKRKEK